MGRLIGRQISKVWVWIETLSFEIEDPLCGFRSYPLKRCIEILKEESVGSRMEFDLQIIVRLFWKGARVLNIKTAVIYPEDGTSNFNVLRDNIQISWAHTLLVIGMIPRIPKLLGRKFLK